MAHNLIDHWDGTTWSLISSPNPGANLNRLYGVTAISANDVWAVGSSILHWDGSSWSVVPSPNFGGFRAVSAVSANDVWAVGAQNFGVVQSFIGHWNGSTWSVVDSAYLQTYNH